MGSPQVTPITENRHALGFMVNDASAGELTIEQATLKSGAGVVLAGTVLGRVVDQTKTTVASAAKGGGNTGNGTFVLDATTPALKRAQLGVYKFRCVAIATNGGIFRLEDPTGVVIDEVTITGGAGGTATENEQIKGVVTDGSTDFALGDGFDITVSALGFVYTVFDPTASDGSDIAYGILASERKDATSAAKRCAVVNEGPCKVNANELVWGANVTTTAQKTLGLSQLRTRGIRNV